MTPFDFINSINNKTPIEWSDEVEKDYSPFIINRGLGYFSDTVMLANEMNRSSHLPKKMQYDFLYNAIKKGKRFSKWGKTTTATDDVELLMHVFSYSRRYAQSVVAMFSQANIDAIRDTQEKGGRVGR